MKLISLHTLTKSHRQFGLCPMSKFGISEVDKIKFALNGVSKEPLSHKAEGKDTFHIHCLKI